MIIEVICALIPLLGLASIFCIYEYFPMNPGTIINREDYAFRSAAWSTPMSVQGDYAYYPIKSFSSRYQYTSFSQQAWSLRWKLKEIWRRICSSNSEKLQECIQESGDAMKNIRNLEEQGVPFSSIAYAYGEYSDPEIMKWQEKGRGLLEGDPLRSYLYEKTLLSCDQCQVSGCDWGSDGDWCKVRNSNLHKGKEEETAK